MEQPITKKGSSNPPIWKWHKEWQVRFLGGTPRKIQRACASRFPKPLTFLLPRSVIFPYSIYDGPDKKLIPYLWPLRLAQFTKHNLGLFMAFGFFDGLNDNDKRVAPSKITPNARLEW